MPVTSPWGCPWSASSATCQRCPSTTRSGQSFCGKMPFGCSSWINEPRFRYIRTAATAAAFASARRGAGGRGPPKTSEEGSMSKGNAYLAQEASLRSEEYVVYSNKAVWQELFADDGTFED